MAQGFTVWLTGLPASGKSAIATHLEESLLERGLDVERLDEGEIRTEWLPTLGFDKGEGDGATRLVGHVCHLLSRNGVIAVAATVSPSQEIRNELRSLIGRFVEVFVNRPVEDCEKLDETGNYERARKGELKGFTGVDAAYEAPVNPEIVLETDKEEVEQCTNKVLRTLELLDWIPKVAGSDYNEEEEAKITKRLKDLGYI